MTINNNIFSIFSVVFFVVLISGYVTEYSILSLYLILYVLAFRHPIWMLIYFYFCGVLNILNDEILQLPDIPIEPFFQLLLSSFYLASFLVSGSKSINRSITITLLLLWIYLFLHSVTFSSMPTLSLLKSASFIFTASAIFLSFHNLNNNYKRILYRIIFWSSYTLAMLSIFSHFTGTGYEVNGTGFQGILNHPQVMGIYSGILFIFTIYLISLNKDFFGNLIVLFLSIIALTLIFMSDSRTGLLMAVIPGSILFLYLVKGSFSNRSYFLVLGFFVFLSYSLVNIFLEDLITYLVKGSASDNFADIAFHSRGPLFLTMWSNIIQNPFTGIGFGVPSSNLYFRTENITTVAGIIVSYPTEKGIMYFAILEELGLIGFIIFMALLLSIVFRSLNRNIYGALLVLAVLASNITEATFVSFGGGGLLFFVFFALGANSIKQK